MRTKLILIVVALLLVSGVVTAEIPVPTGLNPQTGVAWTNGDAYRIAFVGSVHHDAISADIADYNAFLQGLADTAGLGEAAWYVIGSTADVDARDNTNTNPTLGDDGLGNGTGCPILLVDGSTVIANDNADLCDGEIAHAIDQTETGGAPIVHLWVWSGTYSDGTAVTPEQSYGGPLGSPVNGQVSQGSGSDTTGGWIYLQFYLSDPVATLLPLYVMSEILFVGGQVSDPDPEYDATIDPINPLTLSWTNLDPIPPATSVYVDVWFGTDPNKLQPLTYSKVVTAGENVISAPVDASAEGTYYWQVDSYINGPAHINEPNMIEGPVWRFNVISDLPPESVVIDTPEMITWSGEPVQLDATVVDDGKSELTYLWTTDAADGIDVEFDPVTADVEDPTVTINKVSYSAAYVANDGFEEPVLDDDIWVYAENVASWSTMWSTPGSDTWASAAYQGGVYNPSSDEYTVAIPEGENVGWIVTDYQSDHCLYQQLLETIQPSTTYVLSAKVGNPSLNGGATADYRIEIVGSGVAAVAGGASPINNTSWLSVSCSYTSNAGADPNIGQPLAIRLIGERYGSEGDDGYEVNFDEVVMQIDGQDARVIYDPSMSVVTVNVAVSDEANPTPVTDSMTIDVYDTACAAARDGLEQAADHPGDVDADCDVGLADLAVIAEKWLTSTGATGPVVKP